jgi:hypothetical protein
MGHRRTRSEHFTSAYMSAYERARGVARALAGTPEFEQSRRERKRIEMLFAHLKRILRLGRLWLRGPSGACENSYLQRPPKI